MVCHRCLRSPAVFAASAKMHAAELRVSADDHERLEVVAMDTLEQKLDAEAAGMPPKKLPDFTDIVDEVF